MLLLAGLHRDILAGRAEVANLGRYYATVGGGDFSELSCCRPQFGSHLRQAIMARRDSLAAFIRTATVQTNETGRGITWLLPLSHVTWEAVYLVDLGASAGLNLVADARAYRLVDGENGRLLTDIGRGEPIQFMVQCWGQGNQEVVAGLHMPLIAGRTGCDIVPFRLESTEDELTLAAFVWGDQPHRLQRLREGIAALRAANLGAAPVHLHAVNLPDELPQYLERHIPAQPSLPMVIYNTYMMVYLPGKGAELRRHVTEWAGRQSRPILWLQWEPAWDGPNPPEFGWCSWSADLWWAGHHRSWQLAWVHPHGTQVRWQPGFLRWIDFWQRPARVSTPR